MSAESSRKKLAEWLRERSDAVKNYERKAEAALYDDNNEAAYRSLMKEKAGLLASIAKDAASLVSSFAGQDRGRVAAALDSFSANAQTSLRIDSVFYMSALLYPDDHKKGQPNNLEKLVATLEATLQ